MREGNECSYSVLHSRTNQCRKDGKWHEKWRGSSDHPYMGYTGSDLRRSSNLFDTHELVPRTLKWMGIPIREGRQYNWWHDLRQMFRGSTVLGESRVEGIGIQEGRACTYDHRKSCSLPMRKQLERSCCCRHNLPGKCCMKFGRGLCTFLRGNG
jgi:hypothetical protein